MIGVDQESRSVQILTFDAGGSHAAPSTWVYDYDASAGSGYTDGRADNSIGKPVKVIGGEGIPPRIAITQGKNIVVILPDSDERHLPAASFTDRSNDNGNMQ